MRTKFKGREVEIIDYEVGRYFDEACILEANFTDGAMEDLTEDELQELESDMSEELIQDARERAADRAHDMEYDYD